MTTGRGAVFNRARVRPGATVVSVGCGGIGLNVVQGARIAGASRVIAVEPTPSKRALAVELGATDAIDPGDGDIVEAVRELTEGSARTTSWSRWAVLASFASAGTWPGWTGPW